MPILMPDPKHIASAKQAAIDLGIEAETVDSVLSIASRFYHEEQSQQHIRMTEETMVNLGVVYKYRNPDSEYNWQLLENQEIYFANPSTFNDPFDANIKLRFDLLPPSELRARLDNVVKQRMPYAGYNLRKPAVDNLFTQLHNPSIHDNVMQKWMDRLTNKIKIFCICPDRDNILLWSHYANNHKGFTVGFDAKNLYDFWVENSIFLMGYVAYRDVYPILLPPGDDDISTKQDIITSVINIKSSVWAYEKEIRLTLFDGPDKIPFKPELIKEVVLGCKIQPKHEQRIMRVVEEKYPHAHVYRAVLSRDAFALDFTQIR